MVAFNVTKDGITYRLYQSSKDKSFHAIIPIKGKTNAVKDVVIPRQQFKAAYLAHKELTK